MGTDTHCTYKGNAGSRFAHHVPRRPTHGLMYAFRSTAVYGLTVLDHARYWMRDASVEEAPMTNRSA
jgi:hypothetical protein